MSRRAEPPTRSRAKGERAAEPRAKRVAGKRTEIDRTWVMRIVLALIVAVAMLLIARVSIMAFGDGGKRLQRVERAVEGREPARPPVPVQSR